jgi:coenzyme F420 hydrogenase subunit beta
MPDDIDAVIAKPCEISALRRVWSARSSDAADSPVMLAFFCAGTPSHRATTSLITKLGINPDTVTSLRYRGNGWPGNFTVSDKTASASITYDQSWGQHLGRDLQWRCKICPDGTGEDADISVGDLWRADAKGYPLFDDAPGESVVIARTQRGHEILQAASDAGVIALQPLDLDEAQKVQPLQYARKQTLAVRLFARVLAFRRIPRYKGYQLLSRALSAPRLSAKTLLGTLIRSWRDRVDGRRT